MTSKYHPPKLHQMQKMSECNIILNDRRLHFLNGVYRKESGSTLQIVPKSMQLKSRTTVTLILSKTQHNQRAFPAGILCSKRECPHAYQFKTINNNRLANKSALCFWWWTTIAKARSNAASNSVVYYSRRGSFTPKFSTSIRGKTAASSINKKPTFSKCHPANPRLIASSDGCRFLGEILSPFVQTIRCPKWQIQIGGHFFGGE